MAVQTIIPAYAGEAAVTATLGAASSSAEIVLGPNAIFQITAGAAFNVKFGNSGMAAAAATDFQYPANAVVQLFTGDHFDRIRVFSTAGGTYWIQKLDRA